MDKGIRPAAIVRFLAALPTRVNTREGNTVFRKGIIASLEEDFGCTHAAGATHYNHAFISAKEVAKTDEVVRQQLEGLGRPEDKKGGRKKKVAAPSELALELTQRVALLENMLKAIPAPVANPDVAVASEVLESNVLGNGEQEQVAPEVPSIPQDAFETAEQYKERMAAELLLIPSQEQQPAAEIVVEEVQQEVVQEQQTAVEIAVEAVLHSVRKKSDGRVVAEGLTLEEAEQLIAKAAASKKGALELVA
jgi:hypothetical protein